MERVRTRRGEFGGMAEDVVVGGILAGSPFGVDCRRCCCCFMVKDSIVADVEVVAGVDGGDLIVTVVLGAELVGVKGLCQVLVMVRRHVATRLSVVVVREEFAL